MSQPIIKVCGMRQAENILTIKNFAPEWMGFIFYQKSKRAVSEVDYQTIASLTGVKKVGVFVNETTSTILETISLCKLDAVQLHGEESVEQCEQLRKHVKVIKAISIAIQKDLLLTKAYVNSVDYFLFDTKSETLKGGTGKQFDWAILANYNEKIPFLLSGGISLQDIKALQAFHHHLCIGFDINSGFEIEPALKDADKVASFIKKIRKDEIRSR